MVSFFKNVGNWICNKLTRFGCCVSGRGSDKPRKLQRKNACVGKRWIVVAPPPTSFGEFCRKMQVIERAEAQKQIAKKSVRFAVNVDDIPPAENERVTSMVVPILYMGSNDSLDQPAICITDEIQQLEPDNVQPTENKRAMSTIVPFSYATDDYHVDQSELCVTEEMRQLRLYFEEHAHLFNVIVDFSSPRDSAYSAESGCLPPSEYCFS